jgi:hypothetical protein
MQSILVTPTKRELIANIKLSYVIHSRQIRLDKCEHMGVTQCKCGDSK